MSLRIFHMVFVLSAIIGADLFGVWSIHHYRDTGNSVTLMLGLLTLVGGLGLIVYAFLLVRKLEKAKII